MRGQWAKNIALRSLLLPKANNSLEQRHVKKIIKNHLLIIGDDFSQFFLRKDLSDYDLFFQDHGQELSNILEKRRIDLIVIDTILPREDGFYWLNWLKQFHPKIPVILVSTQATADDRLKGLLDGALDYLIKPFHAKELSIRIENILRRSPLHTIQKTIQIGCMELDIRNNVVCKDGSIVFLTQMEADILKFLYINAGIVVSRDEIMEQVRGIKHNPLDRSIDIHINKIRKKIEDNPANPSFIRTMRGKGYSLQLGVVPLGRRDS